VLAHLVDQAPRLPDVAFLVPRPSARLLAVDALSDKLCGVRGTFKALRLLRISIAASGGLRPARAARCSLIPAGGSTAPFGRRRRRLCRIAIGGPLLRRHGQRRTACRRRGGAAQGAAAKRRSARLRCRRDTRVDPRGRFTGIRQHGEPDPGASTSKRFRTPARR